MLHIRKSTNCAHNQGKGLSRVGLGLAFAWCLATASSAAAANIVVNSLADTIANDGACTLREAIINANNDDQSGSTDCVAGGGADAIRFSVGGTIMLGGGLPVISALGGGSDITIDGANLITISGANLVPFFYIACNRPLKEVGPCPVGGSLTLKNVALIEGASNSRVISNFNRLIISNSRVSQNITSGSEYNDGVIYNAEGAIALIVKSAMSGNRVTSPGPTAPAIIVNEGLLRIRSSTIVDNSGTVIRSGIDLGSASLLVSNSTFVDNPGTVIEGNYFSRTVISNSTFHRNGPISADLVHLDNTIVSNGVCLGIGVTDAGNNIDAGTTCGFIAANNSRSNTDPLVDPAGLKNNGGPTQTLALCTGVNAPSPGCTGRSPAIDMSLACSIQQPTSVDQRGFVRPADGDMDGIATCDVGAFESGASPPPVMNNIVSFLPNRSSYRSTADITGCPAGFVGKFSFLARLTNNSSMASLNDLMAKVSVLTNGNVLQNADGGPAGAGAMVTIAPERTLASKEFVDVPFNICLKNSNSFGFFVDVLGQAN